MKKMTKEEAIKYLQNKKVYVNGKSKEIQEKLFQLGWQWISGDTQVQFESDPFLYIHNNVSQGKITNRGTDMSKFVKHEFPEISAEEILSIEIIREFKENEIIVSEWKGTVSHCRWIAIIKKGDSSLYEFKVALCLSATHDNFGLIFNEFSNSQEYNYKPTEEEKQKLINALKSSSDIKAQEILQEVFGVTKCEFKEFDKVLVRYDDTAPWRPNIFLYKIDGKTYPFVCTHGSWPLCIPYKGNEHLVNKTK